jgi:hypothetical protein
MSRSILFPSDDLVVISHQQSPPAQIDSAIEFADRHVLGHPLAAIVRLQKQQHALPGRVSRTSGDDVADRTYHPAEVRDANGVADGDRPFDRLIHAQIRHRLDPPTRRPPRMRITRRRHHDRLRGRDQRAIGGDEESGGVNRRGKKKESQEQPWGAHR